MLGLKLVTDPTWVALVEQGKIEEILTDHAYCEQKAATQCITLIIQYPLKKELVEKLAPVVTEEWGHFRMVLKELKKRGFELGLQRKDEYVAVLKAFNRVGGSKDQQLLDKLLTCAIIEARSCERFRLLSLKLNDKSLRKFYHELMIAEAGHYRLFLDLAKMYNEKNIVKNRWEDFLKFEAELIQQQSLRGDRVH